MRDFNRNEILEDIGTIILSKILKEIYKVFTVDEFIYQVMNKENIEKIVREEIVQYLDILEKNKYDYIYCVQKAIERYLAYENIISYFYEEILYGEELLASLSTYGDEARIVEKTYISSEECEHSTELSKGVYINEVIQSNDSTLEEKFSSLGADIRYTFYDGLNEVKYEDIDNYENDLTYEAEVLNGNICILQGDFGTLFEIQEKTANEKLKKLISYFIKCLCNRDGTNRDTVIVSMDLSEYFIIFFEKRSEVSKEKSIDDVLVNVVIVYMVLQVILEEMKKEGFRN